jgi:hypothetical protein
LANGSYASRTDTTTTKERFVHNLYMPNQKKYRASPKNTANSNALRLTSNKHTYLHEVDKKVGWFEIINVLCLEYGIPGAFILMLSPLIF